MLFTLALAGIVVMAGCWPVVQSQPPAAVAPAATATMPVRAASAEKAGGAGAVSKLTAPTATPKPTSVPSPTAAPVAAAKPTAGPSPSANGASSSPVAVVATAVAKPPVVGPSPAISTDARGTGPADVIGVSAAAGAVADANTADREAVALCGPGAVLSTRAGQQAGRQATVAIPRVAASYQQNTRGQPTFLNDAPYPNHVFTAVIWGKARRQFQPPPESWQGQSLCVTGPVQLYQQRPQIEVSSPSQLRAAR